MHNLRLLNLKTRSYQSGFIYDYLLTKFTKCKYKACRKKMHTVVYHFRTLMSNFIVNLKF